VPLTPGLRIGPYEILGAIGAGGMGEVYRARDTKLGRDVAIKAMPDATGPYSDPLTGSSADRAAVRAERITRFQREAKLLAALNHPHIATIHGLIEADPLTGSGQAVLFIVLEFVDGESLAQKIRTGPVPVPEALALARQIADALQAAHLKGIVHRDLKPANVMITADGRAKVLDFGLAKPADSPLVSGTNPSLSPTFTSAPTQLGMILGTAAYMAPEQAKGKAVDKRADIWAFGCVVYEMLTGRRPFPGDDVTETIAAVIRGEPDWNGLPDLPPVFRQYLKRCFEKNPNERVQDIGDMRLALDGAFDVSAGEPVPAMARSPWTTGRVAGVAVALSLVAALAAWLLKPAAAPPAASVRRFTIAPPQLSMATTNRDIAITPDGSTIVYIAGQEKDRQIYVRRLDALTATALRPAERYYEPVISANGAWVAFNDESDYTLRKLALTGGPPVTVAKIGREMLGATWGSDDSIIYATTEGLWRIPPGGGTPESIARPDQAKGESVFAWPEYLPGGRAVLYAVQSGTRSDDVAIAALDLQTRVAKEVIRGATNPRYAASGHLLYVAEGSLRSVAFDPVRLETRGEPVPIAGGMVTKVSGGANAVVAADGTLVYVAGGTGVVERRLVWIDRAGGRVPLPTPLRAYGAVRVSPDGKRLALDMRDQQGDLDLFIWDFARATLEKITSDPAFDGGPVWTPDGTRLVFASSRAGPINPFVQPADGAGEAQRFAPTTFADYPSGVTPDGTRVLLARDGGSGNRETGQDIMIAAIDGRSPAEVLLATRANERGGEVSPDGKWLAYESDESGAQEVYVRPFPDVKAGRWQVSFAGGVHPAWSPSGGELFFVSAVAGAPRLMGVQVAPAPTFSATQPKPVVNSRVFRAYAARSYDISRDGKRFLVVESTADETSSASIVVVLNWAAQLTPR
jgi:Tol biopolymer transport system component